MIMDKKQQDDFLDLVEKYMKRHDKYWRGIFNTCLVSDVHDIEESIVAKRKTLSADELKEMFPDKPPEEK
jgi:hypothetical protein